MRYPLLTVMLLASCQDKQPAPARPPRPRDGVVLIQPGASPRQVLRYQLTKGTTTTSEMVVDVEVKNDGQSGPLPTQILDLETTVVDVGADGAAKLRITVTDARVSARDGAQMASDLLREQAEAIRGVVVTETLAPDGAVSDTRVELSAGAEKLRGQLEPVLHNLEQVAMRLPGEAVGPGAMWRERRTALPEAGLRVVSEVTYTLGEVAGTTIVYAGVGDASGAAQKIEREGVAVDVTDTHGRSATHGSIDLSRYAIDASASATFATTMTVVPGSAGPGAGRSTIEIATSTRIAPAAPRPIPVASSDPPVEDAAPPPARAAITKAPPRGGKPVTSSRTRALSAKRASKAPPARSASTDEPTESEPIEPTASPPGALRSADPAGIEPPPGTAPPGGR